MKFYVYEHWRPDLNACFWVGKGNGNRAYNFRRNFHYNNIIKKLARLGMCVEVRLIRSGMIEDTAHTLEKERIAFWRSADVGLTNYTDGGEGVSGLRHSAETREIIKEKRKAQKVVHSEETKRKIGAANSIALRGKKNPEHSARLKGRKLSDEHRAKISKGLRDRNYSPSSETRRQISQSNTGQKRTVEARKNMRSAHLGKKLPVETRRKMSQSQTGRWARLKEGVV